MFYLDCVRLLVESIGDIRGVQLQIHLIHYILKIARIRICVTNAVEPEFVPLHENEYDGRNGQNEV
jgi:hypothetical protein